MKCILCDSKAIAVYYFSKGCVCNSNQIQPLCEHHIYKATPIETMQLIKDLTVDREFTNQVQNRRDNHENQR